MPLKVYDIIPIENPIITGATDENYPTFQLNTQYPKNQKVIKDDIIYESRIAIRRRADWDFNTDEEEAYRPIENIYYDATSIDIKTNQTVYIDNTTILYTYTGADTTLDFTTIDFTTNPNFTNPVKLGENGYAEDDRIPPPQTDLIEKQNTQYWKNLGYVNTKRFQDGETYTITQSDTVATATTPSTINIEFTTFYVDSIIMFNINATEVTIKYVIQDGEPENENNTEEYTIETIEVEGSTVSDYIYNPIIAKRKQLFEISPFETKVYIEIKQELEDERAEVGDLFTGKVTTLGNNVEDNIQYGANVYGSYKQNKDGNQVYDKKGVFNNVSTTINYPSDERNIIQKKLDSLLEVLKVFEIIEKEELGLVKGKIKNYSHSPRFQSDTGMVSLQIESVLNKRI